MLDPIAPLRDTLSSRYELIYPIGEGAHATVHLAHDLRHDRRVAIKVLRVDTRSDVGEHRFLREIRLLARLQHPNILPLHDSGFVGNLLYYVMPYVDGETLRGRLSRERQLSIADAVSTVRELAEALSHAHGLGIVHRDVKPENILLTDGRPLLADFGIALALDAAHSDRITHTGAGQPGTPAYMSPEQLLGDREVDARTDVYALGCLLYELIVGEPPFAGPTGFTRRFTEDPPSARAARSEVPPAIDRVIRRALTREPDRRFQTAHEMATALGEAAQGPPRSRSRPKQRREATPRSDHTGRAHAVPIPAVPEPATTFIGRESETALMLDLLAESRLVTVLGPGGIGKTRLVQHVIGRRADQDHTTVHVVPLGGIASAELLWTAIGSALHLAETDYGDARTRVLSALRRRRVLLVLDAFEHLMPATHIVRTLLEQTADTRVVVTSRVRLNLSAEAVLELEGLARPKGDESVDVGRHAAVQLFAQRARQVIPRFAVDADTEPAVIRICNLVDGLPLGIELAASMLRVLDCNEISAELSRGLDVLTTTHQDVPLRHRNLRAVFDQSWSLLDSAEQDALMRLSIFAGSFGRTPAERIAGSTLPTLRSLRDKSLVQHVGADRYQLHEVVRQHARERLAANKKLAETADAHASFYAAFVEVRATRLGGAGQRAATDELLADIDEIRAAWHHAVATRETGLIERLMDGVFGLYDRRGWFREGAAEFADAAAGPPSVTTARALARWGAFLLRIGEPAAARSAHVRSLRMLRDLGAESEMMLPLRYLAEIATVAGKYRAAERLLATAVRIASATGNDHELALSHISRSHALIPQGRLSEAERVLRQAAVLLRELGNEFAVCTTLSNLGCVLHEQGRSAEAEAIVQHALDAARLIANDRMIGVCTLNLANIAHECGNDERAAALARSSLERFRGAGVEEGTMVTLRLLGDIEGALGRPAEALSALREALRAATRLHADRRVMAVLVSVAELFARTNHADRAIELVRVVESNRSTEVTDLTRAVAVRKRLADTPGSLEPDSKPVPHTQQVVRALLDDSLAL